MDTFQQQLGFFDAQWPELKVALERDGAGAMAELIRSRDDAQERRVLFMFANRGMVGGEWEGKNLDDYITVADAGIAEFLAQAGSASEPALSERLTDGANMLSYNLSADLADCWPGDPLPREERHFARGLKAALDCIHWRELLRKGPGPFSMAYWAKGMHELSLGRHADSMASFNQSLEYARRSARDAGTEPDIDFAVILGTGYLGITMAASGNTAGWEQLERAEGTFRNQLEQTGGNGDASFGLEQLATVKQRYLNWQPAD
jgi:hypothetical protein